MQHLILYRIGSFFAIALYLNNYSLTDELLKLFSLHQLFGANIKNKGTARHTQHGIDLVDADVAVFCGFSYGQCHF